jgi:predicted ATPase
MQVSENAEVGTDGRLPIMEPILEYFRLEDVNGYKTIQLNCEASAKIVSAENGSGKTTLLSALYAILAGKPAQLQKVHFSRFALKFRGKEELLVEKAELAPISTDLVEYIKKEHSHLTDFNESENELLHALTALSLERHDEFYQSDWFQSFYRESPFDRDDIRSMCEDAISDFPSEASRFSEVESYVSDSLQGATVLYLPTYRRIEAEMPSNFRKGPQRPRRAGTRQNPYDKRRSSNTWSGDQLIYFGLEDVESKLREIADTIRRGTFEAYTRIGGRTLEQLLDGPLSKTQHSPKLNLTELNVVFTRLGKANGEVEDRIAKLISSGEIDRPQHEYLRSFLGQLLEVYASDKDQEQAIEAFVSVINSYWKNDFDEKSFVFNKVTVSTWVENKFTGTTLPLNALSSGEKQIVSIFARLYLSGEKKFVVLIDEPELSLSMDWQKRFLPDILRSPSCLQLIAITHSPFVFDNELDPFAGPLKISNRKTD